MAVEVAAHRARDAVAQPQALRHHLAPQVEVAVLQAHFLAHLLIELERQRLGAVQQLELARQQLHLARGQVARSRCPAGRARTVPVTCTTNSLRSRSASAKTGAAVRVEHDLQQALAVAQVDEDHPAVVAPAVHPAGDRDLLAEELLVDLSAVM